MPNASNNLAIIFAFAHNYLIMEYQALNKSVISHIAPIGNNIPPNKIKPSTFLNNKKDPRDSRKSEYCPIKFNFKHIMDLTYSPSIKVLCFCPIPLH